MNNLKSPLNRLSQWRDEESMSSGSQPLACLSTIGLDGFPNARVMVIKDIVDDTIIITGPVQSRKGKEIEANNKVALTFCWKNASRQIRIQGIAERIPDELADEYFEKRSASAKAVSIASEQGKSISDESALKKKIAKEMAKKISQTATLSRPDSWGGYYIRIKRIEFMEFSETQFHKRELFELENDEWISNQLQP